MRTVSVPSRPISPSAPVNGTNASLTCACAMRTASGPSLRTVSSIDPGSSTVRSTASSSTGTPLRSPSPGPSSSGEAPMAATISSSGTRPSSQAGARRVAGGGRFHYSTTSKKPCQPSSVNSDWWAWNMNRPVRGKRSSRTPRWPWHCMTVSVSSTGCSDVPVGK